MHSFQVIVLLRFFFIIEVLLLFLNVGDQDLFINVLFLNGVLFGDFQFDVLQIGGLERLLADLLEPLLLLLIRISLNFILKRIVHLILEVLIVAEGELGVLLKPLLLCVLEFFRLYHVIIIFKLELGY